MSADTEARERAVLNTDRELWRERDGDYYADSVHVTEGGGLGIQVGGHVIVKTLKEWHRAASEMDSSPALCCGLLVA